MDGSLAVKSRSGLTLASTPTLAGVATKWCAREPFLRNDTMKMWAPSIGRNGFGSQSNVICGAKGFNDMRSQCLRVFEVLKPCQYVKSGMFFLEMIGGKLVISQRAHDFDIQNSRTVWISSQENYLDAPYSFLVNVQTLGIYGDNNSYIHGLNLPNSSPPITQLCLFDDGNLILYSNSTVLWTRPPFSGFEVSHTNDQCVSTRDIGQTRIHNATYMNCIRTGQSMAPCDTVRTGDISLKFLGNGNLILFDLKSDSQLWTSGLTGQPWSSRHQFAFQSDGNYVIYNPALVPLLSWMYTQSNQVLTELCVHPAGSLVAFNGIDEIWKNPPYPGFGRMGPVGHFQSIKGMELTCLLPGEKILSGQYLRAGKFYVLMQTNGILAVKSGNSFDATKLVTTAFPYSTNRIAEYWKSSSEPFNSSCGFFSERCSGNFEFAFTVDGRFTINDNNDGKVVNVYKIPAPSGPATRLCIQDDGDFILYGETQQTLWAYPQTDGFAHGERCGPVAASRDTDGNARVNVGGTMNGCQYLRVGSFYLTMHHSAYGNLAFYNGTRGDTSTLHWESALPSRELPSYYLSITVDGLFIVSPSDNSTAQAFVAAPSSLSHIQLTRLELNVFSVFSGYPLGFTMKHRGKQGNPSLQRSLGATLLRSDSKGIITRMQDIKLISPKYFDNGTYYLVMNDCRLMFLENSAFRPDIHPPAYLMQNYTLLWSSNTPVVGYNSCYLYIAGDSTMTISIYEDSFEPIPLDAPLIPDRIIASSDKSSFFLNKNVRLNLEAGRLLLVDIPTKAILWNSLNATRVSDSETFGFRQNNDPCGSVGDYKVFPGNSLGVCVKPLQVVNVCEYLRIGNYHLNLTEFGNLELYQGRPTDSNRILVWNSTARNDIKNINNQFLVTLDSNLLIRDKLTNETVSGSGDNTIGLDSDAFCLLDTGLFGLFKNNSLVWSRPRRSGFNGFDDDVCWNQPNANAKKILPVGHYYQKNSTRLSCMKRGETMQPCQYMKAGNYSLGFQMTFTNDARVISTKGNLVLYAGNDSVKGVIWSAHARHIPRKQVRLSFDKSGDIVVYDGKAIVSNLGTMIEKDSTDLCVQSDGRLVLYNVVGEVWSEVWSNPKENGFNGFGGDRCGLVGHRETVNGQSAVCMHPGDSFRPCQYLNNGEYFFTINANSTALVHRGTRTLKKQVLWSSKIEYPPSVDAKFVFGMDRNVNITNGQVWIPNVNLIDVDVSKEANKLCLLPDGTLSLFDSKNTSILWTASAPSREFKNQQSLVQGRECGNVGHWRPAINGVSRRCMLPGESLRICQWINIDDLWFTWAARINSFNNVELMLYRGGMYFKSEVLWSAGTNIPNSLFSMLYFDYQSNGNLVLTTNGTDVVGVTNLLTDQEKSSYLCLQSDAKIVLYDLLDNVIWQNPGNVTGFSGSGKPCE
ncbi:hypothetical protein BDR26DRAFT_194703 [Obelidium mucronatum]|nr:hypothetical protein BDR26DRAFT_194703 [Obelidium mucronatum]